MKQIERLIPCSAFVLHHQGENAVPYATFLQRALELWMFVPCGEDGKPLTKPLDYYQFRSTYQSVDVDSQVELWYNDCLKYEKAKERCLFEGFEYVSEWYDTHLIAKDRISGKGQFKMNSFNTVEKLITLHYPVTLTPTALKEIYGS